MQKFLSAKAPEFVPQTASDAQSSKPKKTKDQRACPRKRRKNKIKEPSDVQLTNQSFEGYDVKDSHSVLSDDVKSTSTTSTSMSAYIANWIEKGEYSVNDVVSSNNVVSSIPESNEFISETSSEGTNISNGKNWNKWISEIMMTSKPNSQDYTSIFDDMQAEGFNESDMSLDGNMEVEWLNMQNKWKASKNISVFDEDIQNEAIERRKWSNWAIHAAETERQRRIRVLRELDEQSELERKARSKWAVEAIEREQKSRVYQQFLMSMTGTNWFNEAISSAIEDYELVCPYYKLGCNVTCHRSTIAKHLEDCRYALDCHPQTSAATMEDYEVVCPNSVLGCTFTGGRHEVISHLESCSYSHGQSKEQEDQERLKLKHRVITECEVERVRRVTLSPKANTENKESDVVQPAHGIHNLLQLQTEVVLKQIHEEVSIFSNTLSQFQALQQPRLEFVLSALQSQITKLWPYATLEVYGSYATGLHDRFSDLDLVVCFSDEYDSLSKTSGSYPLINILAEYLQRDANSFLTIKNVILNARVPLIKAAITIPAELGGVEGQSMDIDISIDSPVHSGIATAEMVKTLIKALPPLKPIVALLKSFLRAKGLTDAYHGGLSSYGITLLSLIPMLKRIKPFESKPSISVFGDDSRPYSPPLLNPSTDKDDGEVSFPSRSSSKANLESESNNPGSFPSRLRTSSEHFLSAESDSKARRNSWAPDDSVILTSAGSPSKQRYNTAKCPVFELPSYDKKSFPGSFSWTNILKQKEYGRRVAIKLLAYQSLSSTDNSKNTESSNPMTARLLPSAPSSGSLSRVTSQSSSENGSSGPGVLLSPQSPLLGELLEEILHEYGEEMQCGVHGFSVRNGGFRFEVAIKNSAPSCSGLPPPHPHASAPIVIEDPVNVMNNIGAACYKALAIQRFFLEAHDRFKSIVVRCNSPTKLSDLPQSSYIFSSFKETSNKQSDSSKNTSPVSSRPSSIRLKKAPIGQSPRNSIANASFNMSEQRSSSTSSESEIAAAIQAAMKSKDTDAAAVTSSVIIDSQTSVNHSASESDSLLEEIFQFEANFISAM